MKKILFTLLAVVAGCSSLCAQNDWAMYFRYEEANKSVDFKPVAVFMGNSITDGWYARDTTFFRDNNYVGRGISGQVTSQMLCRFQNDVIELHPQCVVILAGINDIARNNGEIKVENIFRNIKSMCQLAVCNGIEVVICSTLPCSRVGWRPEVSPAESVRRLNALLKAYAAENEFVYVDYYSRMADENGGLPAELSDDGCHPTPYGYSLMKPLVMEGIRKAVKR